VPTRPYYYWTENRTDTTSNSQMPAIAPYTAIVSATREDDDEYVRSIWTAQLSIVSDGTNTTYGWWAQAAVRLVISWDPEDQQTPSDVGDNDPLTLGFCDLFPARYALDTSPHYSVVWKPQENGIILETARAGDGVGVKPQLLGNLYYYSQYAGFSSSFESSQIRRIRMTGRVLWRSKTP
jgi:hypothetical protein